MQDGLPISASAPSAADQVGVGQGLGNHQVGNDAALDLVVRLLHWPARPTTLPQPKQSTTRKAGGGAAATGLIENANASPNLKLAVDAPSFKFDKTLRLGIGHRSPQVSLVRAIRRFITL